MQASTSQVESYAGFNISHPVPDFKAVRSLNIPNYEFLNKPRPLQRCESLRRTVQLWMSYEWPSSLIVRIPYFRFGTILIAEKCWSHLLKIILQVETILEVISCLKLFQKRFESFFELSARMHDAASWWTWWSLWRFCGAVVCCQTR